uniref:hypothetical protein n=1 Tax=Corynebacterium casei TaxID=160386 RepID=UPI001177FF0B|nr:hypothetical protein [Corynebacterium casei]
MSIINENDLDISVETITVPTKYDAKALYEEALLKVPLIPTGLRFFFLVGGEGVELLAIAHHLFFDGTAFWNTLGALFVDGIPEFLVKNSLTKRDSDTVASARRLLVSPTSIPHSCVEIFPNPLKKRINSEQVMQMGEKLIETLQLSKLLTPRRISTDGFRSSGADVTFEEFFSKDRLEERFVGKKTGSLSLDVFPMSYSFPGLSPVGAFPLMLRTDCDCLIEELPGEIKVSVISRHARDSEEALSIIQIVLNEYLERK